MTPNPARAPRGTWPPHRTESRPWHQLARGGTGEDRTLSSVEVSLPPFIADARVPVDVEVVVEMETALREVAALDSEHGAHLEALGRLLLRAESVASSKIEHIEASVEDYARALHGVKANPAAVSMAAATTALDSMIRSVNAGRNITMDAVHAAHLALMGEDPHERNYAGRVRDMQNWIGGSDYSPRNALYVPPPPETLDGYLDDLMRFANRDDVPVLAQVAIAHAQFESVHPFTDGNGRIGRALINTILRRRGATRSVVVPLASALVAHRDRYFDLLSAYRIGNVWSIQKAFAGATRIAATESSGTARRLIEIPARWREMIGPVRSGSAVSKLLDVLPSQPVLSSDDACSLIDSPTSSVYAALDRLRTAEVIRPLTERKRNQIWGAGAILDELEDLGKRITAIAN